MPPHTHRRWSLLLGVLLLAGLLPTATPAVAEVPHVLVYSGTYGFRHDSIAKGNLTLQALADETGAFTVEFSELPTSLSAETLRTVDLVLFNSTTGRIPLSAEQRAAMVRFWGCGGGFAGVHAAADANYGWAEWAEIVGAQFDSHPHGAGAPDARLIVENAEHPVNAAFADVEEYLHGDEYYRWRRDVRGTQDVLPLLSLDEGTVAAGIQTGPTAYVDDQPLAWVKTFRDRGRVFYTNLGHNQSTWDRAEYRQQLVDGISWIGEVTVDEACLDGTDPLPPAPAAPAPAPLDPEDPREPCTPAEGQRLLTPAGLTYDAVHPTAPAYFGRTTTSLVLDLSTTSQLRADVRIAHAWPNRIDDYDLAVTTPWGFAGSDAAQPASGSGEDAVVTGAVHCSTITVDVYNLAALTTDAGTVSVEVNPVVEEPGAPGSAVPPAQAVIVAPPAAVTTGFVAPAVVLTQGSTLQLVGGDTLGHNVICAETDAFRRPLCKAPFAAAGEVVDVAGVSALPPGSHAFYCGLHPNMTGTITIL